MSAANDMIAAVTRTAAELATAARAGMHLVTLELQMRDRAIRELIGTHNPLTDKPHSLTSAEKTYEISAAYMEYRAAREESESDLLLARGKYEAAKLEAELEVGLAVGAAR